MKILKASLCKPILLFTLASWTILIKGSWPNFMEAYWLAEEDGNIYGEAAEPLNFASPEYDLQIDWENGSWPWRILSTQDICPFFTFDDVPLDPDEQINESEITMYDNDFFSFKHLALPTGELAAARISRSMSIPAHKNIANIHHVYIHPAHYRHVNILFAFSKNIHDELEINLDPIRMAHSIPMKKYLISVKKVFPDQIKSLLRFCCQQILEAMQHLFANDLGLSSSFDIEKHAYVQLIEGKVMPFLLPTPAIVTARNSTRHIYAQLGRLVWDLIKDIRNDLDTDFICEIMRIQGIDDLETESESKFSFSRSFSMIKNHFIDDGNLILTVLNHPWIKLNFFTVAERRSDEDPFFVRLSSKDGPIYFMRPQQIMRINGEMKFQFPNRFQINHAKFIHPLYDVKNESKPLEDFFLNFIMEDNEGLKDSPGSCLEGGPVKVELLNQLPHLICIKTVDLYLNLFESLIRFGDEIFSQHQIQWFFEPVLTCVYLVGESQNKIRIARILRMKTENHLPLSVLLNHKLLSGSRSNLLQIYGAPVVKAIKFLHENAGIAHGSISGDTIHIKKKNGQIILPAYSISSFYPRNFFYSRGKNSNFEFKNWFKKLCNNAPSLMSDLWVAPEIEYEYEAYPNITTHSDIWSLGILFARLIDAKISLIRNFLFEEAGEVLISVESCENSPLDSSDAIESLCISFLCKYMDDMVLRVEKKSSPQLVSKDKKMLEIIAACLRSSPKSRPSIENLLESELFEDHDPETSAEIIQGLSSEDIEALKSNIGNDTIENFLLNCNRPKLATIPVWGDCVLWVDTSRFYKIDYEKVLGIGGSGRVYKAVNRYTGRSVAIKLIEMNFKDHTKIFQVIKCIDEIIDEFRIVKSLSHPNIIRVIGMHLNRVAVFKRLSLAIVMELAIGNVRTMFVEPNNDQLSPIPKISLTSILRSLCRALVHVHAQKIVHLDIKSSNILIMHLDEINQHGEEIERKDSLKQNEIVIPWTRSVSQQSAGSHISSISGNSKGSPPQSISELNAQKYYVVLADFGLASKILEAHDKDSQSAFQGVTTTSFIMSPEMYIFPGQCGNRADIWALGILAMELAEGKLYYEKGFKITRMGTDFNQNLIEWCRRHIMFEGGPKFIYPPQHSDELLAFTHACLNKNPLKRPSAEQLLTFPLLKRPSKSLIQDSENPGSWEKNLESLVYVDPFPDDWYSTVEGSKDLYTDFVTMQLVSIKKISLSSIEDYQRYTKAIFNALRHIKTRCTSIVPFIRSHLCNEDSGEKYVLVVLNSHSKSLLGFLMSEMISVVDLLDMASSILNAIAFLHSHSTAIIHGSINIHTIKFDPNCYPKKKAQLSPPDLDETCGNFSGLNRQNLTPKDDLIALSNVLELIINDFLDKKSFDGKKLLDIKRIIRVLRNPSSTAESLIKHYQVAITIS